MRPLQMIALIRKPAGDKGEFVGLDDENVAKYWFWPATRVRPHVENWD